jgi:hypothetical protein
MRRGFCGVTNPVEGCTRWSGGIGSLWRDIYARLSLGGDGSSHRLPYLRNAAVYRRTLTLSVTILNQKSPFL